MKLQVSHGADPGDGTEPQWFIVLPLPGQVTRSAAGTPITNEMAVQSLLEAGRTVHEIEAEPWQGYPSGHEARQARRHAG